MTTVRPTRHDGPEPLMNHENSYTCAEYREEMMLLGLRRRLANHTLTEEERRKLLEEIEKLECAMNIR